MAALGAATVMSRVPMAGAATLVGEVSDILRLSKASARDSG
jgi:hypothetical protein